MTSDRFCHLLDRLEEIGNYSLPSLRAIAGEEPGDAKHWSRGKCIAEIIDQEFQDDCERP